MKHLLILGILCFAFVGLANAETFKNTNDDENGKSFGQLMSWVFDGEKSPERVEIETSDEWRELSPDQLNYAVWIGHATYLINNGDINILTDPIFAKRASPIGFAGPKRMIPAVMTFGPGLYKKTNKPECHLLDYRGYTYGYNRFVKKVIWDEKLYIAYPKCLYAFVNPGTKIKTITLVPREYIVRKSIAYKIEFEKNIQDSIPTLKDSSHCEKCQRKFGSYSYKSNKFGPICFSCALPVENFYDNWCFDYYSQRYFKRVGPLIDVNTKIHGIWIGFSDNDGNTYFKINKCEQTVYQDEHENIILCYLHFD